MAENKTSLGFSRYKGLVIGLALIGVIGLGVLVIVKPGRSCDGIFEQTAPRLESSIELIKSKGAFALRREKIQELAESAQKVGLHLKTCCLVLDGGKVNSGEFQQCILQANAYEKQIVLVADQVREAEQAKQQGATNIAQDKVAKIDQAIQSAASAADTLARQVEQVKPSEAAPRSDKVTTVKGAEKEPNDTILEANEARLSAELTSEVSNPKDVDFFKLVPTAKLRDIVKVKLQNLSTSLRPHLTLYNENKSQKDNTYDGTLGADLEMSFTAEPAKAYFVRVHPFDSSGKYKLVASYANAYDRHEPNDTAEKATPLSPGKSVEANIMDKEDSDWYKLSGVSSSKVSVRLQNRSSTLRPHISIYDENRSAVTNNYNSTLGASLELTFDATPGKDYYVLISPYDSTGGYELIVK